MIAGLRGRCAIGFVLCVVGIPSYASAAGTMSIEEFLQTTSKWDGYAKLSTRLRVEGRYTSISPKLMRLAKCNILFRPKDSQELPTLTGTDVTVLVEGVLEKTNNKFQFVVDELRQMPSDEQSFFDRMRKLDPAKSDGWFELGDWAVARGKFYDDKTLLKLADESYRKGIQTDYENLPKGDASARFQLAEKGNRYNLGDEHHARLVHEGYRIEWSALQSTKDADFQMLLDRIARDMPGARDPLTTMPPDLEKRYRQTPLRVYEECDVETRRKLHRLLYNDVVLRSIERNARPDGSNGFEIAEQIDQILPEWHGRADFHRQRELEFKLTQVADLTQQQAVALAEQFDTRGQPDKAKQVREQWLTERSKRVARDDPEAMIFLAEQYELLLADKATAVRLLLEAYEKRPESKEIASMLVSQGYTLVDGKWLTAVEVNQIPVNPVETAIREGRVAKGMSRDQVERALGKPTSITRVATTGAVSEVWVYREKGVDRVIVQFQRGADRNAGDARVVASF